MQMMAETKIETKTIEGKEYYPLQRAARLTDMTGWGLKQRLLRMGKETKKLPGSNRVYVRKDDIDFLLGKEPE